jgi:hypothetical protein
MSLFLSPVPGKTLALYCLELAVSFDVSCGNMNVRSLLLIIFARLKLAVSFCGLYLVELFNYNLRHFEKSHIILKII